VHLIFFLSKVNKIRRFAKSNVKTQKG